MTRVALNGLLQRKLRALLTALAVMLGVAMVSGTFMLTDSIEKAFTSIFNSGYAETDVVVSGRPLVEGASSGAPIVPERVLADVRALPGVAAAGGSLMDLKSNSNSAKLLGRDGKPISTGDSPNLGLGMDPKQPQFTPMELSDGDWPVGAGQIVIDAATAGSENFSVGDKIRVAAGGSISDYTVTGIATLGDAESLGGATIGVFDVAVAQDLFNKHGYDTISITARDGTSPAQLMKQIRPVLPANVKAETSAARAAADSKEVTTFISYLRYALLAFGGIALFVGGFVIFNTLTITIAQRTRELATLRTLGASRRQVMRSVVVETAAIGALASLGGLALGYGLSRGLSSVFGALGLSLPEATTVIQARTIVLSLVIGVGITLLAGVLPAFRATRIAPINAVREGATAASGRPSRLSLPFAVVVLSIACLALGYGLFAAIADQHQAADDRRRLHRRLRRCGSDQPPSSAAARNRAGLSRTPTGRRSRTARHSERDPQPQPHRRDRRRPHGRLDAGHHRRRARPGLAKLVHQHRGAAGHGRVRRHLRERVRHAAADGRQADWQDPGSRKLERTQRQGEGRQLRRIRHRRRAEHRSVLLLPLQEPARGRPDRGPVGRRRHRQEVLCRGARASRSVAQSRCSPPQASGST